MNSTGLSFVSFLSYHSSFLFEAKLEADFHEQFPSEPHIFFHTLKFTRNTSNFPTAACRALDPMVTEAGQMWLQERRALAWLSRGQGSDQLNGDED